MIEKPVEQLAGFFISKPRKKGFLSGTILCQGNAKPLHWSEQYFFINELVLRLFNIFKDITRLAV